MGVLSAFTGKLQRIRPFQLLPEQELYVREHGTFRNYLINSSPPPPLHKSQPRNTIRANPAAAPRRAPGAQRAAPAAPGTRGAAPALRENAKKAQARPGRALDPRGAPLGSSAGRRHIGRALQEHRAEPRAWPRGGRRAVPRPPCHRRRGSAASCCGPETRSPGKGAHTRTHTHSPPSPKWQGNGSKPRSAQRPAAEGPRGASHLRSQARRPPAGTRGCSWRRGQGGPATREKPQQQQQQQQKKTLFLSLRDSGKASLPSAVSGEAPGPLPAARLLLLAGKGWKAPESPKK